VTAPIGLILGIKYMAEVESDKPRPEGHGMTVAAIAVCVALTTLLFVGLATTFILTR
jgi:hypothetical protein